jgi:hypothetical protein
MITMRSRVSLALFVILALAAVAHADPRSSAKVTYDVPKTWDQKHITDDQEAYFVEDTSVNVLVWVVDAKDAEASQGKVDVQVARVAQDVHWGAAGETSLNGMKTILRKGTAIINGQDIELAALTIMTPSGKAMIVRTIVTTKKVGKRKSELDAFLGSIKPAE